MYSRLLRNVFNVSLKKVKDRETIKNASLTLSPTLTLAVQKVLTCTTYQCNNTQYFCTAPEVAAVALPKDSAERKIKVDGEAQKELETLLENPETKRLKSILELEIEVMRQDNECVPQEIRGLDWIELLKIKSRSNRQRYLRYRFVVEKKREQYEEEKKERALIKEESMKGVDLSKNRIFNDKEMIYGFGHNFLIRRVVDTVIHRDYNWNAVKAVMFGNKIIFDCSFDKYMNQQETKSCVRQIGVSFVANREHDYPCHIYLCNCDLDGQLMKQLNRLFPNMYDNDFPATITSKSYMELFNKKDLIYLSANAPKFMESFDPTKAYIIGSYVDKGAKLPISLENAKRYNILSLKLPLDQYVHFGGGSGKNLTLNQVAGILLERQRGTWDDAMLKHIPRRKLYQSRMDSMEKRLERCIEIINADTPEESFNVIKPKIFHSSEVHNYSHSARARLRQQWEK